MKTPEEAEAAAELSSTGPRDVTPRDDVAATGPPIGAKPSPGSSAWGREAAMWHELLHYHFNIRRSENE